MCCQLWLSPFTFHSEMLAWASAQIHCQFHASESRVALPTQGTKQDVQAESDTVLIPSRGEKWAAYTRLVLLYLYCYIKDKENRIKIIFLYNSHLWLFPLLLHLLYCLKLCGFSRQVTLIYIYHFTQERLFQSTVLIIFFTVLNREKKLNQLSKLLQINFLNTKFCYKAAVAAPVSSVLIQFDLITM